MKNTIIALNKKHLKQLIDNEININGLNCSLMYIDVSKITNMSNLFSDSGFIGDISNWNTENVTTMDFMFSNSKFNGDLSSWNVSRVLFMNSMFMGANFNNDISSWDVSNVRHMNNMFEKSSFKQSLDNWQPLSLEKCVQMFYNCNTPNPYWFELTKDERMNAIKIYQYHKKLNLMLDDKKINKKNKL